MTIEEEAEQQRHFTVNIENQFKKSQFLKLDDNTEKCRWTDSIINCLHGLKGIQNDKENVLVMLLRDNKMTLKYLMPFIRRTTKQINRKGPSNEYLFFRHIHVFKSLAKINKW